MSEKNANFEIGAKFSNIGEGSDGEYPDEEQNSFELKEVSTRVNNEPSTCETVVIEEPNSHQIPPSTSLEEVTSSVEEVALSTKNGITKLEVKSKNLGDALNYLRSSGIEKKSKNSKNVILVKIQIEGQFGELRASKKNELSNKYRNNSIVTFLASKCQNGKLAIYWKSKDLDYFVIPRPYTEIFSKVDVDIYEFITVVLVESLKNGHLGLDKNYQLSDETNRVDIFHISDSRGYNLLLLAGEAGKVNVAVSLIKLGLDPVNQDEETNVQELALQNSHYDVILGLYKKNMPFPDSMVNANCTGEFKNFALELEEFHRMVILNDIEKVKEQFRKLPRTRYFHNFANESALKVATVSRAFECYDYLLSEKLRFAPHESPREHYDKLGYDDQRIVREIHNKYTQELQEQHINVLIAKSFLSHDAPDSEEKLKSVHKAYQTLNANVLIKIILMIVAASKNFKIIFDFNRDSVDVADPTATSETQGLFYTSGRIYIGARQLLNEATAHETIATIAHELCHFAMNLVYGNDANPYKKNDNKTIQEFEEISKKCQENSEKEKIIGLVYSCYPTDMYHAELIVRVVHLLAFYCNQPEKLAEVRDVFGQLFDFYEYRVFPEMREALSEIDGRAEKEMKKKDKKISKLKKISIISGIFAILVILGGILIGFTLYTPHYSFTKLSLTDQIKIRNARVNYKCVQVRFQDLFNINSTAYEKLTSDHISLMLNNQVLNFSDPYVHYLDELVVHYWGNLTVKLRENFLSSNFTFQNENLGFRKLNEKIPKAFRALSSEQIVDVLDGNELAIGKIIPNSTEFYVDRKFWNADIFEFFWAYLRISSNFFQRLQNFLLLEKRFEKFYEDLISQKFGIYMHNINKIREIYDTDITYDFGLLYYFEKIQENFVEILNKTEYSRMFILSAEAGTGKTVTFEQYTIRIKKMFPTRWVSYIDLKDHKQLYNKNEFLGNILGLLEEIFGLKSKDKFEREIFEELFETGEVVLLWNGFDEISPEYSDFIINVLGSIYNNTQNIQFVCTRPLYKEELRNKLGVHPYTLIPFSEVKQEEFLRKFFISAKNQSEKVHDYVAKVFKIIKVLNLKANPGDYREDFNTPLVLEMIASLIANDVEIYESENLFEIYQKFIRKKIEIWKKKSDFASKFAENIFVDYRKFDMMRVYQMYALRNELIVYIDTYVSLQKHKIMSQNIPKELTSDEISRMGILYINGKNEFKFAHKTFSEFFVAQYFIENIYNAENFDYDDAVLIIELFRKVTSDYKLNQVMKTNFIRSFLETQNVTGNEKFDARIAKIFRTKFGHFFFNFLWREESEIFEFLFDFFKKDHKLLVDLLRVNENETLYTAAFNRAYFDPDDSTSILNRTKLKELGKSHLTEDEYEKFIHGKNQKGIILISLRDFYYWDKEKNRPRTVYYDEYDLDEEVLNTEGFVNTLDLVAKKLTENEVKELFLSTSSPASWYGHQHINYFRFLEIVDHYLTLQERKIFDLNLIEQISRIGLSNQIWFLRNKTEENFTNSEVFEAYKDKNILYWAALRNLYFVEFWNFFTNHTSENQQREILLHEMYGLCHSGFIYLNQKCYYHPPFNILHLFFIFGAYSNTTELYEKYFSQTEMQEIILKSNDFLPYVIWKASPEQCEHVGNYLKNLFSGNEKSLKEFLLRKIKPTNLNIFEFMENIGDFPNELKPFSDLLESLSNIQKL